MLLGLLGLQECYLAGSCVLKASVVEFWSIPSIDTLNQHSIDTSVDTWSTLYQHLGQQSILIFDRYMPIIDHLLIKCPSSVDQVSIRMLTKYRSGCRLSMDLDVDWGYRSRLSIKGINQRLTRDAFRAHDPFSLTKAQFMLTTVECYLGTRV